MQGSLEVLVEVRLNFSTEGLLVLYITFVFIMFGVALALLFNPKIFRIDLANGGMAFIAAWWGIWHILAGLTIARIWSKWKPKN